MKSRHAAALALAVWYLMYPSEDRWETPISGWSTSPPSYATAKQCRTALKKELEAAEKRDVTPGGFWENGDQPVRILKMAQCFSGKDPRLLGRDLPKWPSAPSKDR
jgi:hypothetical protein